MEFTNLEDKKENACSLPRKQQAIEALLTLAWRKEKKDRPTWLIQELSFY